MKNIVLFAGFLIILLSQNILSLKLNNHLDMNRKNKLLQNNTLSNDSIANNNNTQCSNKNSPNSSQSTTDGIGINNQTNSTCGCKNKITIVDIQAIMKRLENLQNGTPDHNKLHDISAKRDISKGKKLSKYFIEKLLVKLDIPQGVIDKCIDSPLPAISKSLKLVYKIASGSAGYGQLFDLSKILCEELRIIPSKLNDPNIYHDVQLYLNTHIYGKVNVLKNKFDKNKC